MPNYPESPPVRIRLREEVRHDSCVKVIGVGDGGGNAINRMIEFGVKGVEFISVNTDRKSLRSSKAHVRLQIGAQLAQGLGAGGEAEIGRSSALEASDEIIEALEGADMVIITAGLGGGTGTGAVPVIASIAGQVGALTVAVVTRPFVFEGKRRMSQAERGLRELLDCVDTIVVIPNQTLLDSTIDKGFFEYFQIVDDVLCHAVQDISDILTVTGFINRDFADVRTTMAGMGYAVIGTASRAGSNRAVEAALAATLPLLEGGAIGGARGILINITGSSALKLSEVNQASTAIQTAAREDVNIVFGAVLDERFGDEMKITVIATGFDRDSRDRAQRRSLMLGGFEQPTAILEEESPYELKSPFQDRVVTGRTTDPKGNEPATPDLAKDLADEADSLAATHDVPAGHVDLQKADVVFNESTSSGKVFPFALDKVQATLDGSSSGNLTLPYDEELLAVIDGPPFDSALSGKPGQAQLVELSNRSETAGIRHAAMAAYNAVSAPEVEIDAVIVPKYARFSEILEGRRKLLDAKQIESDNLFDDDESPDTVSIAHTSGQPYGNDGNEGESESNADALRSHRSSADVAFTPPPGKEFSYPAPLNSATPAVPAGSLASEAAQVEVAKRPTPDFNRKLNRQPHFSLGVKVV